MNDVRVWPRKVSGVIISYQLDRVDNYLIKLSDTKLVEFREWSRLESDLECRTLELNWNFIFIPFLQVYISLPTDLFNKNVESSKFPHPFPHQIKTTISLTYPSPSSTPKSQIHFQSDKTFLRMQYKKSHLKLH